MSSSMYGGRGPTGGNIGRSQTGMGAGDKIPSGYRSGRMQQFTPEMMELFQSLFSQVGPDSFTSKLAGGDEETFNQMEAPALRQFSGLQGNIASRFSGMGSFGGRHNSGFQNTMSSAASNFAQDLQSRRTGLQQQAIKDLMGMSGDLLNQRPYENFITPKQKPFWQEMLSGLAGGAGQAGGSLGSLYGAGKLGLMGV